MAPFFSYFFVLLTDALAFQAFCFEAGLQLAHTRLSGGGERDLFERSRGPLAFLSARTLFKIYYCFTCSSFFNFYKFSLVILAQQWEPLISIFFPNFSSIFLILSLNAFCSCLILRCYAKEALNYLIQLSYLVFFYGVYLALKD